MLHATFLMPLLPLVGFCVLMTVGRRLGDPLAGWIGTAAVGGSFVVALITFAGLFARHPNNRQFVQSYFTWIHVGGLNVHVAALVDPLSITMCLFVTGVSALIHLYSIGYMKGDPDYPKFFTYLNLFVFSMLALVLADNLLVTFVGWEGVGLCSYWLVSYWFHRDSAASAGKKAFIYNRVGDAGFLLAMFLIFSKLGTLNYLDVFAHRHLLSGAAATMAVLALFLAATGKSAQIPLFNWLPDAMEGPTPVSALIHAATMVTAGVYLLCRMSPVLGLTSGADWVIGFVGVATAFVAATIAVAQRDIKKVLAFSTVSQIGYMMLAVGAHAYVAAIFLMVAHAFYKGLLFLGAGSVIHGLSDEQDLKRMGNLRRWLPVTYATYIFGWLAIAGVPPFSGFWAKGDVLITAFGRSGWAYGLYGIGIVTALLTAFYMTRLFVLAFFGDDRWSQAVGARPALHQPHEAPPVMTVPLVVLAVAAAFAGALDLPWVHSWGLAAWLGPVFPALARGPGISATTQWVLSVVDTVVAIVGLWLAWGAFGRRADRPELEPAFLQHVWYWDDAYDALVARPGRALARVSAVAIDGRVIDGAVNGSAELVRRVGAAGRRLQSGYVRNYAVGISLGAAAILAYMLSRAWG